MIGTLKTGLPEAGKWQHLILLENRTKQQPCKVNYRTSFS